MEGFAGVTAMETKIVVVTVSVVDPLTVPKVAAMVDVPTPIPVARPLLEIVATACNEELHVTALVKFCVLPSL